MWCKTVFFDIYLWWTKEQSLSLSPKENDIKFEKVMHRKCVTKFRIEKVVDLGCAVIERHVYDSGAE